MRVKRLPTMHPVRWKQSFLGGWGEQIKCLRRIPLLSFLVLYMSPWLDWWAGPKKILWKEGGTLCIVLPCRWLHDYVKQQQKILLFMLGASPTPLLLKKKKRIKIFSWNTFASRSYKRFAKKINRASERTTAAGVKTCNCCISRSEYLILFFCQRIVEKPACTVMYYTSSFFLYLFPLFLQLFCAIMVHPSLVYLPWQVMAFRVSSSSSFSSRNKGNDEQRMNSRFFLRTQNGRETIISAWLSRDTFFCELLQNLRTTYNVYFFAIFQIPRWWCWDARTGGADDGDSGRKKEKRATTMAVLKTTSSFVIKLLERLFYRQGKIL